VRYKKLKAKNTAPAVSTKQSRIIGDKLLESHEHTFKKKKQLHIKYIQAGSSVTCAQAMEKSAEHYFFP
jgi:hypothetical protein